MKFSKNHKNIELLSKNNLKIIRILKRKFAIIITMAMFISIFSGIELPVLVYASTTSTKTPTITTQPSSQTVYINDTAKLEIEAKGSGKLSYKWYGNITNSTSRAAKISGATSSTYSAPTTTAGTKYYYCIVTNRIGTKTYTTTSYIIKVVVKESTNTNTKAPTITTQPNSKIVYVKNTAGLEIKAAGSGKLSYKWYSNISDSTSGATKIDGATSSTYYAPTTKTGTKYYYCIVTNTIGAKTYTTISSVVKVVAVEKESTNRNTKAPIVTESNSKTVYLNDTAKLNIQATGTGTLYYNWYSNTTNRTSGGTKISGETSSTYSAPTTKVGTKYYYCIVENRTGGETYTTTSNVIRVVVKK